ncbi:hypothetical protein WMF18_01785 [Sorangium sp. So ce315]|uniref:hypothetical protein n=1 Tax=Sorangium sp. So ce315 TaxID=3133299 RepID=UPI003F5F34C7
MKARCQALFVVLAVLLAAAVGWQENGRRGRQPSRPATSTCEVNVSEKVPKRGKAGKDTAAKAKKPRLRLGPEFRQSAVISEESAQQITKLNAEAEASGALVVDLPTVLVDVGNGEQIRVPESYCHDLVGRLDLLAQGFMDHARRYANDEAAAVGHILTAVHKAIDQNDLAALNAEGGPHTWARKYIRPGKGFLRGAYLPIEDTRGRLLKDGVDSILGGFRVLSEALEFFLRRTRAADADLSVAAVPIARCMASNFPGLSSLSSEPDFQKRFNAVGQRITGRLSVLGRKWRAAPEQNAARDIARDLLETEFKLSGKDDEETRKAFLALDTH